MHQPANVWKSNIKTWFNERLFLSTVESILLYGSETCTITKAMKLRQRLDGSCTRMLRIVHNVTWKEKIPSKELYAGLPPVSSKVSARNLKVAGHCVRHPDEGTSKSNAMRSFSRKEKCREKSCHIP